MSLPRGVAAVCVLALVWAGAPAWAANDPGLPDQWGLAKVRAPDAWSITRGAGIVVAVVDTGVDLKHEDLVGRLVGGRNFVEDGTPPQDDDGHGTHVAGIVGAATDNGKGVASVAPGAGIMPVRVLRHEDGPLPGNVDEGASGDANDVIAGMRWAVANGAHVVNLSLGEEVAFRSAFGSALEDAVREAWSKGVICVLAAGNDYVFPSGYGDIDGIVVSATDRNDAKPGYSNGVGNAKWGMAAPGGRPDTEAQRPYEGILSTYWIAGRPNSYAAAAGTSMAAPHVAGAAAMLRALGKTPKETVDILLGTADDIGSPGRDSTFGSGRLNVARAVEQASGRKTVAAPPPSGGGLNSGVAAAPPPEPRRTSSGRAPPPPVTATPPATAEPTLTPSLEPTPTADGDTAAPPTSSDDGGDRTAPVAAAAGAVVLAGSGAGLMWRWRRWRA
jgi:subtilisin family serine protease